MDDALRINYLVELLKINIPSCIGGHTYKSLLTEDEQNKVKEEVLRLLEV